MYRIRARFTKTDRMKFISHLDLLRLMERALRRAAIPLSFSQGFNPHPKISFATALSLGVSSEGEYMDIEVEEEIDLKIFMESMNRELPQGIKILQSRFIELKAKALMAIVEFSTYIVECNLENDIDEIAIDKILHAFMKKEKIITEKTVRKRNIETKKEINIRPLIDNVEIIQKNDLTLILKMNLATGSNGNLKPEVVIDTINEEGLMKIRTDKIKIHRLDLYLLQDNKLITPLETME